MKKIGNGKNSICEHTYKGFIMTKTGTREFPWNIYKEKVWVDNDGKSHTVYAHAGFAMRLRDCRDLIDKGFCEELL